MRDICRGVHSGRKWSALGSFLFTWLVGLALMAAGTTAHAQVPDISGTYSGTISGSESGSPPCGGPVNGTLTVEITQSGSSFTGSFTFSDPEETVTGEISNGSVDAGGNYFADISGEDSDGPFSGTIQGTFSNDELSIDIDVQTGEGCFIFASGTLTRVSGNLVVNPVETPSSTITNTIVNTIQVQAITNNLSTRIGDALRGMRGGFRPTATGLMYQSASGQNAGDGLLASGFGLWSSYSYSDFDNDLSSTALDGSQHSILAGIDISPWEAALFGIAIGYENSDIDTAFNRGNMQSDGFTVAPYAGFLLTDLLSVDAALGYTHVDIEQFRTDPATGARITSDPISDRWFGAFNMNLFKAYNEWLLGAQTGFLYMRNTQDSFTESNGVFRPKVINKLDQWHITGDVAYSLGEFEPFARLTYEYDYTITEITVVGGGPQPSHDRDGLVLGLGVRYFSAGGISGNLEWNKRLDRDNFDEDIFMLTVRGEF